jgi:hypothetical protein
MEIRVLMSLLNLEFSQMFQRLGTRLRSYSDLNAATDRQVNAYVRSTCTMRDGILPRL